MKSVLYVANGLGRGGAERQLLYWLGANRDRGTRSDVVVTGPDLDLADQVEELGATVHVAPSGSSPRQLIALLRTGRHLAPDVCHSVSTVSNVATAVIARATGAVDLGAVRNDWIRRREALGPRRAAIELEATRNLVVNSRLAQRQVEQCQRRRRRVHYLPNAVDVDAFDRDGAAPPGRDALRLVSVGSLTPQKRHDRGIDAVEVLATMRPDVAITFRIVGAGPLEAELSARARRPATTNLTIEVAGAHRDVGPDLRWADALVLASDFEGTPNVVLEAMAAGLPVVSTPVGDVPAILSADCLADNGSARGLADRLEALWSSPDRWTASAERNRRSVRRNHSLESIAEKLWALYDQI